MLIHSTNIDCTPTALIKLSVREVPVNRGSLIPPLRELRDNGGHTVMVDVEQGLCLVGESRVLPTEVTSQQKPGR